MSGESSSPDAWRCGLEPAPAELVRGGRDPDDPRLGDVVTRWTGGAPKLRLHQPVLMGFACDEGVRRNGGRQGAALAPDAIRPFLYRLTARDPVAGVDLAKLGLVDLGNIRVSHDLENGQERLSGVIAAVLREGAVPIVLGGGHETTFAHYLGHARAELETAIINVDAHTDVRPYAEGGHSGSPFRQAMELPKRPLKPGRYAVIGAQRQSVATAHVEFVTEHGGQLHWLPAFARADWPVQILRTELDRLSFEKAVVHLTIDADAFRQADVPGTSAPSPVGLHGAAWPEIALVAGTSPAVRSIDLVEVNPNFDRDGQTCRWAALGVRQFLVGLAKRE
jgi:formiminoglutamase